MQERVRRLIVIISSTLPLAPRLATLMPSLGAREREHNGLSERSGTLSGTASVGFPTLLAGDLRGSSAAAASMHI
jgi:hypothetical protein